MRTWLQTLQRGVRYRVTRGGFLFTLAVALVAAAAVASANNLLFLVVATMLSVLLMSGLVSRLGLAGLDSISRFPEHVSAGRAVAATLAVRNLKLWMPSFSVHVSGVAEQPAGDTPPILTSAIYFPIIPGRAHARGERRSLLLPARRAPAEQLHLLHPVPVRISGEDGRVTLRRDVLFIHPSNRSRLRGSAERHQRRSGSALPGPGPRVLSHPPLRALRKRAPRGLESHRAHGRSAGARIRPRTERAVEIFLDRDVRPGAEPWFELAIDCCAFLAWRLHQQGAGIRFQTQDFQVRLPEEGDVYTILRYLALVHPLHGEAPEPPIDEQSFQIVFSADPRALEAAGWNPDRVLRPGDPGLAADYPSPDSPA